MSVLLEAYEEPARATHHVNRVDTEKDTTRHQSKCVCPVVLKVRDELQVGLADEAKSIVSLSELSVRNSNLAPVACPYRLSPNKCRVLPQYHGG